MATNARIHNLQYPSYPTLPINTGKSDLHLSQPAATVNAMHRRYVTTGTVCEFRGKLWTAVS